WLRPSPGPLSRQGHADSPIPHCWSCALADFCRNAAPHPHRWHPLRLPWLWMQVGIGPAQIDLSVHLDSCFGSAKVGPGEKRQRKIDGCGVERIERVFQFHTEILPGVKGASLA